MSTMPKRRSGLLLRTVAEEAVVYDPTTKRAVALLPDAARVFAHCDGATPKPAVMELVGPRVFESAMREIADAGLLDGPSRRTLLQRGAVMGGGILVTSILTPTALAHASGSSGSSGGSNDGPHGTLLLSSTYAPDGTPDPLVKAPSSSPALAYNYPTYVPFSGTGFVNVTGDGSDNANGEFTVTFTLPAGAASTASLSGGVRADNAATVSLNGALIGANDSFTDGDNNLSAPSAAFVDGSNVNTLGFDLQNFGGPTALDFHITITY